MRCVLPYLPTVALVAWAVYAFAFGDQAEPFWLLVMAITMLLSINELRKRYHR